MLTSRRRVTTNLLIAVGVAALGVLLLLGGEGPGHHGEITLSGGFLAATAGLTLLARRKYPVTVLVVVAVLRPLILIDTDSSVAGFPALAVALYTLTRSGRTTRRLLVAIPVGVVLALITASLELRIEGSQGIALELFGHVMQSMLPIALGEALRARAERVRATIEAEVEKRMHSERLRIARDLHDVVAHGLSVMTVQSGVAAHLIDRDVDQARDALQTINATGRRSLEELRTMVGVLRSTETAELGPIPTDPNDLADLVEQAAQAGVGVNLKVEGAFPDDASDASVVATHRIVQEALTNVARHAGPVPADVTVVHEATGVTVRVSNELAVDPSGSKVASTGVGIVGMRERAETLGGTFNAGPLASGGFEVAAVVPYLRRKP